MNLSNLLISVAETVTSIGKIAEITVKHEWICNIIAAIIKFAGDVGLGIILFTVILKLITLAPDIWSRVSMKKNSLKMEAMKEDLEKLQKQYAKNKDLYNQKMMALYKKNGYSAFSACLPTIITLVFFFIVIGAFNSYSQVSERNIFSGLKTSYDKVFEMAAEEENPVIIYNSQEGENEKKNYTVDFDNIFLKNGITECFTGKDGEYTLNKEKVSLLIEKYPKLAEIISADGVVNAENQSFNIYAAESVQNALIQMAIDGGKTIDQLKNAKAVIEEEEGKYEVYKYSINYEYFWNVCSDLKEKYSEYIKDDGVAYSELIDLSEFSGAKSEFLERIDDKAVEKIIYEISATEINNLKSAARQAAADWYESDDNEARSVIFPWVKNIWAADCAWTTAIPATNELLSQKLSFNIGEEDYNELTYNLGRYKETGFKNGNGWFILVALSILTMALSTVVSSKSQKTQMQLSTVEGDAGTAASTQKMMTWMMPIMFGVFSFIYSAAFSIYMVTNSLLSTGSMVLINLIVEKSFKNKIEKQEKEKLENHRYGKMR